MFFLQLISSSARIPARLHEVSNRRSRNPEPYFFGRFQKHKLRLACNIQQIKGTYVKT